MSKKRKRYSVQITGYEPIKWYAGDCTIEEIIAYLDNHFIREETNEDARGESDQ